MSFKEQDLVEKFNKVRGDFPLLSRKIRGKQMVYLDAAATSLKPWPVIERVSQFLSYETANVHRGAHFLANQATNNFEDVRTKVAKFIGASSSDEIVFTKGATDSINLVANSWGFSHLKPGDSILLTELEHHANIVPWQLIAQKTGAAIEVVRIRDDGTLDLDDFHHKLKMGKTKMFAFTHCSNTLGIENDAKELTRIAKSFGAAVLVDGAQMIANKIVDVLDIGCDFYVFSGHKMFASYGVGVLYAPKKVLNGLPPYQGGGNMIDRVTFAQTTFQDAPFRFEAGTPNIEGVLSLGAAIDYIEKLGRAQIFKYEEYLTGIMEREMQSIPELNLLGVKNRSIPIFSFLLENAHHADVGQILDEQNIAVRVGHHCTQPLMDRLGVSGTVRASLSVYNNESDILRLIEGLKKAKEMLL